jgi:signal transduction histidine kinase
VQPVIDDLIATISQIHAERRIAIDATVFNLLTAAMDPADLAELLGNLLDNAVRHAASRVALAARMDGRQLLIVIVDDGPGISPADRDRAMRPGIRLDERGDGDGFGLSIAREIAELHGGTLSLDAGDRGGLAVSIALPAGATNDPMLKS